MILYRRIAVATIVVTLVALAMLTMSGAGTTAGSRGDDEVAAIKPIEEKVLFTIPACRLRYPLKPGAILYDRWRGFNEFVRGLEVVDGHIQVWDSIRLLEFDQEGNLIRESEAPKRSSSGLHPRSPRFGPWRLKLDICARQLHLMNEQGVHTATLSLPKDKYPRVRLLNYFDGQTYLEVHGKSPDERRFATLYSVSPEGLTLKVKLPARVLFGGSIEQLMPDGTKYYVEYVREQNCYQVVKVRYSLKDLRLPEPPTAE